MSSPCSPFSRFPFSMGCSASLLTAAVDPSGFSGGACGVPKSGPHPMTGVPSRTWFFPIAGTGVPLLVHSCIHRSRAYLRLSWATASLLTTAAALASAWAARICCSLTASSACSARWVCSSGYWLARQRANPRRLGRYPLGTGGPLHGGVIPGFSYEPPKLGF